MFVESLEKVPEEWRADFVEFELDGKKGFQHKDTVALANSLKNAKTERGQYRNKATEYEAQMSEAEKKAQERIEHARQKAMDEALTKGDKEEAQKRFNEQMADLEKRTAERVRKEVEGEFSVKIAKEKSDSLINELAAKYARDENAIKPLKKYISSFVSLDENGKQVFLDENGGATSLDAAGFEKEFFSNPAVGGLVKGVPTTVGGGLANGNNGKGGASNVNAKAEEAKKKGDLTGFLKANIST